MKVGTTTPPLEPFYLQEKRLLTDATISKFGLTTRESSVRIPIADGNARIYVPEGDPKIKWETAFVTGQTMPLFVVGDLEDDVLVCEGEFDALLAHQNLGTAVVTGTGGANNWLTEWSDRLAGKSVTLLYDADEAGRNGAQKAAMSLLRSGARVCIAEWPDGSPKGFDVTDFFRAGGTVADFREIIVQARAFAPPTTLSKRAGDFVLTHPEPVTYLVDGIWPEGALGYVSGAPKVFKSFLAMDMAFAVATGGLFLGQYQAPTARKVMVVQMESSRAAFRDRLERMGNRFGGIPDNLYIITNEPILLEDKTWVERLTNEVALVRPELLILDPLASMTGADENSNQEMGAIVRLFRNIRDKYGCAICIVHHQVKDGAGRRAGQKLRGAGALYGAAEVVISMDRPDDEAPRVAVRVELKESDSPKPFFAEFNGETADLRILTEQRLLSTEASIREFLESRGKATVADMVSALNLKPNQARDAIKAIRGIRLEPGTGTGNKPAVFYIEKTAVIRVGGTHAIPDPIPQTTWEEAVE